MSGLITIETMRKNLSPAEQKIADYILAHPQTCMRGSSSELASNAQVSQSSVVKFSQKLGFKGFSDLKLAISQSLVHQTQASQTAIHGDIDRSDNHKTVMNKLLSSKLTAMEKTVAMNSEETLDQALQLVRDASRIQISGMAASSLVAKDLGFKLMKLGKSVLVESDGHIQLANASSLTEKDLLIAISHSGRSREVLGVVDVVQNNRVPVIAITQKNQNELALKADVLLPTIADEDTARSSSISARDAQFLVTDTLFLLLTQVLPDAAEHIAASRKAIEVLKR